MDRFEYAVLLKPAEEGGFIVTCRDLPQLITQGEDVDDALVQASDAMDELFAAFMKNGFGFPAPSQQRPGEYLVSPPAETMAKAALYEDLQVRPEERELLDANLVGRELG